MSLYCATPLVEIQSYRCYVWTAEGLIFHTSFVISLVFKINIATSTVNWGWSAYYCRINCNLTSNSRAFPITWARIFAKSGLLMYLWPKAVLMVLDWLSSFYLVKFDDKLSKLSLMWKRRIWICISCAENLAIEDKITS